MTPFDTDAPTRLPPPVPPIAGGAPGDALIDAFARRIDYMRVSVTDRCDLRCTYCMPERMRFLPRAEVLDLEELDRLCTALIGMGVRKLRLTGGEPLVRRGVMTLVRSLSRHLTAGALHELTLTTNGTRLAAFAAELADCGVRRINVSLDTLDAEVFARLTRGGDLASVMAGLDAAQAAGLKVKINAVALRRDNLADIPQILQFAHARGFDLTLIETMPMGEVDEDRSEQYVPLGEVRDALAAIWTLTPEAYATGGPARYMRVAETGGRIGFITPMSHNFCDTCNRVRVTCTGMLHPCLGDEGAVDLRGALRAHPDDDGPLRAAVRQALVAKPRRHAFLIAAGASPSVSRHMSVTGG
jgi:cyclic pyranopterin phosphate synthase